MVFATMSRCRKVLVRIYADVAETSLDAAEVVSRRVGGSRVDRCRGIGDGGTCLVAMTRIAVSRTSTTRILGPYRRRPARGADTSGEADRTSEDAIEPRLRLAGLRAERDEIRRHGRLHGLDDMTVRRMVRELDLQEARFLG